MSNCSNFDKNFKCSKSKQTMINILLNEHKQDHLIARNYCKHSVAITKLYQNENVVLKSTRSQ